MTVSFLPSQTGSTAQTPLPYTANPLDLLFADFSLVFHKISYVFGILRPLRYGVLASPYDELYPSCENLKAIFLHAILVIAQLGFLISLPWFLVLPLFWVLGYIAVFYIFNKSLSRILNGTELKIVSKVDISNAGKFNNEYWIYLNGVSVGRDWLQSNIDRLSVTFGRTVYGVHNPTDGIIFDLIQCLIQRNFAYNTADVREVYASIKKALFDPRINKVVFIAHSQGGIECSLILDWLLAEAPQDHLRKLEVFTFGNAANHFNNPKRGGRTVGRQPTTDADDPKSAKAIGYIEHYANIEDFVSQFGVLHYASVQNRYMGRVFTSPYSGHLLNQHYLHQMFPLGEDGKLLEESPFMETEVSIIEDGEPTSREGLGETLSSSMGNEESVFVGDINSPISPLNISSPDSPQAKEKSKELFKVKNFSRLWQYRNGRTPPDDGVRRVFTT